jgi:hypothetical protein
VDRPAGLGDDHLGAQVEEALPQLPRLQLTVHLAQAGNRLESQGEYRSQSHTYIESVRNLAQHTVESCRHMCEKLVKISQLSKAKNRTGFKAFHKRKLLESSSQKETRTL